MGMIKEQLGLLFDGFTIALIATVVLASLLPCRGDAATVLGVITMLAIALLFFMHGAKLSREAVIADILRNATQQGRAVAIVPTADVPDVSLMDAGRAARIAQALTPEPWLPDRRRAADAVRKAKFAQRPQIVWLSDGIEDGEAAAFVEHALSVGAGTRVVCRDVAHRVPRRSHPPRRNPFRCRRAPTASTRSLRLAHQAFGLAGRPIAHRHAQRQESRRGPHAFCVAPAIWVGQTG